MNRTELEAQLAGLPVAQYAFFDTTELEFSPRIRTVCEVGCPRYGKTWACPPAVGTVDACKDRCLSFPKGLVITTLTEVGDIANLEETLATRADHEAVTQQVFALLKAQGLEVMGLSTESCAICEQCAYPDAPCRHQDQMFPCVESQGIIVSALAEKLGMDYLYGGNIVTWFSLLLFREE